MIRSFLLVLTLLANLTTLYVALMALDEASVARTKAIEFAERFNVKYATIIVNKNDVSYIVKEQVGQAIERGMPYLKETDCEGKD